MSRAREMVEVPMRGNNRGHPEKQMESSEQGKAKPQHGQSLATPAPAHSPARHGPPRPKPLRLAPSPAPRAKPCASRMGGAGDRVGLAIALGLQH
ncbi:hypothetical protein Rhe02_79700 [Rhizocola hellebori]|uniref:Uncharacterized protein n=1 Tax=Rhizocola hellebori TaxID=1392758 RepID=A0A8J3QFE9_9ACTN|nr:hypothetical protein Rhe02_79700 [Rhizocola hellebori]